MNVYKKLAYFAGGLLCGSAGLKLLASKDAKNVYVHIAAAGLRVKDSVMETVTNAQEHVADIVSSAKDLNEARDLCDDEIITDDDTEDTEDTDDTDEMFADELHNNDEA